ncbi:MAG: tetratricopeptide repeat protein [Planctomycetota bacterium]|nr:tetratricopeptide repeat protein [Planctomycetota bacterium]
MTGNTRFLRATLAALFVLALAAAPALAGPLEKAQAAAKKQDWKTAAEHYVKVLEKEPEHRAAAIGLVEAAVNAGLPDLYPYAEDGLLALREKNARDWDVVAALGRISLALSASKEDTLARKSYDAQAIDCFETVLSEQPTNGVAAAGLAEVHFQSAQFQKAIAVVDKFLAKNPKDPAKALFWKGQSHYFLAQDAFRASGNKFPLSEAIQGDFRRAQGAFRGATAGDPKHFDGWMQLAYASAWLSDRAGALEGYRQALALDGESSMPFRGIEQLLQREPDALHAELKSIVEKHPEHPQGLYYLAYNRFAAKEHRTALGLFERYVKVAKAPAVGWYWLGKSAAEIGDEVKAESAFEKALKADPDHRYAAWELDVRIQRTNIMARARKSPAEAQKVIQQYAKLFELAPRNASMRNNLAFTLREAYGAHQGQKAWLPILRASTKFYVEASDILGEWTAEKEATLGWKERYAQAQIISDTGLMFQFYDETRDIEKAIEYYEIALEYTEDGYRDAFNNYTQILAQQERWDDLYELAKACSTAIKTEAGQPDTMTRNRAKAIMQKLIADGKVKP